MDSKKIQKELIKLHNRIDIDNPRTLLKKFNALKSKYPSSETIQLNEAGFRIDCGTLLKSPYILKKAIGIAKDNLSNPNYDKFKWKLNYDIANAYIGLFNLKKYKFRRYYLKNDLLQKTKEHLRIASKESSKNEDKLLIYVNYANCLDTLGRHLEALKYYDKALQINSKYAMAKANKAKALTFFANVSNSYETELYIIAYQDMKEVINNQDLLEIGGLAAKEYFSTEMKKIEKIFNNHKNLLDEKIKPLKSKNSKNEFNNFYFDFNKKNKLFLNFDIAELDNDFNDPIFINLITKIDDNSSFFNLSKSINEIKEDFLTARYLLAHSQYKQKELKELSQKVTLVNTLDYAMYNIYTSFLKNSYKIAYNILDKIAFFINDYLKLNMKESDVYFHSIWELNKKELKKAKSKLTIKPQISKINNICLYALYDLSLDFKGEYKLLKDIRNSLTHRKLTIYDSILTDKDKNFDTRNMGYDLMLKNTLDLFHIVKSAIIYLICFVQIEENKKIKDNSKIPKMTADTWQIIGCFAP